MTGATVPADCDCVIPIEQLDIQGSQCHVLEVPNEEDPSFIHHQGSDFPQGATLIQPYARLNSREIAVAATVGKTHLEVIQPPKITILSTGDEVVPIHETPTATQIRQSNAVSLQAALANSPFPIVIGSIQHHHLSDDPAVTTTAIADAIGESDLILTTGGISKGKYDFIRQAVESHLGSPIFHGVSQKPGKPLALWHHDNTTLFALPGNPMSVSMTFHRYVTTFLQQWFQQTPQPITVMLNKDEHYPKPLTHFVPAALHTNRQEVTLHPLQNSGDLASSMQSTGFVEIPQNETFFPAGTTLNYFPWL